MNQESSRFTIPSRVLAMVPPSRPVQLGDHMSLHDSETPTLDDSESRAAETFRQHVRFMFVFQCARQHVAVRTINARNRLPLSRDHVLHKLKTTFKKASDVQC